MSDIRDTDSDLDRLRELPIRSEDIGYAPDAMIACEKCSRANAPNRDVCLYCGAALAGSIAEARLEFRHPEIWESGFNVVLLRSSADNIEPAARNLASLLASETQVVQAILRSGKRLPIARVGSDTQAEFIVQNLSGFGVETSVVSDEDLLPVSNPVRLRSIRFTDDELVLEMFGKPGIEYLPNEDLALIVSGVLLETRTESIEKRKRRETKTLSEIETSSDTPVIDIYSKSDPTGWRIPASGFDFSCLGSEKSLLVTENMERLIPKLQSVSPTAKFVNDYADLRPMLEHSWPRESRTDALGFQRSGFARREQSRIFTTNNSLQLTKYSRLQWHLL